MGVQLYRTSESPIAGEINGGNLKYIYFNYVLRGIQEKEDLRIAWTIYYRFNRIVANRREAPSTTNTI